MNFTIPKTTPPGKYLVRAEHFNMNTVYNQTQQFIGCAQVEVTGPGGGTPGPFIKFPGGYDIADPGKLLAHKTLQPCSLLRSYAIIRDFIETNEVVTGIWLPTNPEARKYYKHPGPAVWKG